MFVIGFNCLRNGCTSALIDGLSPVSLFGVQLGQDYGFGLFCHCWTQKRTVMIQAQTHTAVPSPRHMVEWERELEEKSKALWVEMEFNG